jgi:hypothetical protein
MNSNEVGIYLSTGDTATNVEITMNDMLARKRVYVQITSHKM